MTIACDRCISFDMAVLSYSLKTWWWHSIYSAVNTVQSLYVHSISVTLNTRTEYDVPDILFLHVITYIPILFHNLWTADTHSVRYWTCRPHATMHLHFTVNSHFTVHVHLLHTYIFCIVRSDRPSLRAMWKAAWRQEAFQPTCPCVSWRYTLPCIPTECYWLLWRRTMRRMEMTWCASLKT